MAPPEGDSPSPHTRGPLRFIRDDGALSLHAALRGGSNGLFVHRPALPPHPDFPKLVGLYRFLVSSAESGVGMLAESYWLFAIGNLAPIWSVLYPTCYDGNLGATGSTECNNQAVTAPTYVEISALIVGMVAIGYVGDVVGRLLAGRITATLMLVGGCLIVSANGVNLTGQFIMLNIGLFILGLGVGGEYPIASSNSAERSESSHRRGAIMVGTFSMQGWGNFLNTAVICFLLAVTSNGSCSAATSATECNMTGLEVTWRLQYGVGILIILYMVSRRFFKAKESQMWERAKHDHDMLPERIRQREARNFYRVFFSKHYSSRLFGVSACWFMWGFAFYGNKLFQSVLISAYLVNPTILQIAEQTLLNSAVALAGYYAAAATIDWPRIGRTRMQGMGFFLTAGLFLACGLGYNTLVKSSEGLAGFQTMYLLSSFFAQFGANCTTFILPGEIFPTAVRSESHGIAAAAGKLGALAATLAFSLGNGGSLVFPDIIFVTGGAACFIGFLLTVLLIPNTGELDLHEVDAKWEAMLLGEAYEGKASEKRFLSYFEIWLGVDRRVEARRESR